MKSQDFCKKESGGLQSGEMGRWMQRLERDGPRVGEGRQPLEAGKRKELDFPLEPPVGSPCCQIIVDF